MKLDMENYAWQLVCINRRTYEKIQMIFVIFCIIFPIYMIKLITHWEYERGRDNHENRKI